MPAGPASVLRVVIVNYGFHTDLSDGEELVERYYPLREWAEGLAAAGAHVSVAQAFKHDQRVVRSGITYRLVRGGGAYRIGRWSWRGRLHRAVAAERPDVVHLNGLCYPIQTSALASLLDARSVLVVQHHAEKPERGLLALVQRRGLRAADGFLFSAHELAKPWRASGMISARQPVFELPELSTRFRWHDRREARRVTGLTGEPIFLWVGRLDPDKDPLTVLRAFAGHLLSQPEARLYMIYQRGSLERQVQRLIASRPPLHQAVKLVGTLPHDRLEPYFSSSDYFVLGSHREGWSCALIEAMVSGCVPIVTDIPANRVASNGGAFGALWPVGDVAALRAALAEVCARPLADEQKKVRAFFAQHLSYEAIGRRAIAAYRALLS